MRSIDIVEADANNLVNVSAHIPSRAVTLVMGVSGSGKTSLLQHTLAVEGDRRNQVFLGLPSSYDEARQSRAFIGPLPPMVHVGQRGFRASVRTTVGTATGLLATMRRLFLALGVPYSDDAKAVVVKPDASTYADWLQRYQKGEIGIWAVPAYFETTDGAKEFKSLAASGIEHAVVRSATDSPTQFVHGRSVSTRKVLPLDPKTQHAIEAEVGKVTLPESGKGFILREMLDRAFRAGNGRVIVELPQATDADLQSEFGPRLVSDFHWVHPKSPHVYAPPSASLLSFNSPSQVGSGACKECMGTGRARTLIESRLALHPERSMHRGAFSLWTEKNYKYVNIQHETIEGLRGLAGFNPDSPWNRLSDVARQVVLEGWPEPVADRERGTGRKLSTPRRYDGFLRAILDRVARGSRAAEELSKLVDDGPCLSCGGSRWSRQARALRIAGKGIHELLALTLSELEGLTALDNNWRKRLPKAEARLVEALHEQSSALVTVGLGHLTADRGMLDISDGESRRTRLAAVLNAGEEGLLLLLDEPARGLHEQDLYPLAAAIERLGKFHTVVVNEHRSTLMAAADHVIELGPGAGTAGGRVTYEGVAKQAPRIKVGETRPLLPIDAGTRKLCITGASLYTLRDVDCEIPLNRLTCLVGLSGSGKSNFVRGILVPGIFQELGISLPKGDFAIRTGGHWQSVRGLPRHSHLVALDHRSPSLNRRSVVGTYTGVFDDLRALFARTDAAKLADLKASDFSLNSGKGRCGTCLGLGEIEENTIWLPCPACGGTRYSQSVLSVRVRDLDITQLLALPVSELHNRADILGKHASLFDAMDDLGIGYLGLGRRIDTMSGGEVQRLRIAERLAKKGKDDIFILDEPAAGLHPLDVARLLQAVNRIVDEGSNTVVLVEHNLQIIANADWVIEFGPGSGPEGGQIVFSGTPAELRRRKTPTGKALSGTLTKIRSADLPSHGSRESLHAPTVDEVERVISTIRRMRGEDINPADRDLGKPPDRPAVVASPEKWEGRRLIEVADLDNELLELALDMLRDQSVVDQRKIAAAWKDSGGHLAIHPYLPEMRVWGAQIPASVQRAAGQRLTAAGLRLLEPGADKRVSIAAIRATGPQLESKPTDLSDAERRVAEALALGGGYVELYDNPGRIIGRAADRAVDLERGIVGPTHAIAASYSRRSKVGACPVCAGTGVLNVIAKELLIRSESAVPTDERFLTVEALELLRGIRRSDLVPLIQTLAKEGLWPKITTPFKDLSRPQQDIVMHGCWSRPGHGTFLRPKKDPQEVAAWMRWNGLHRTVLAELSRSKHKKWRLNVMASAHEQQCSVCAGTGLQSAARVINVSGRTWQDWMREGSISELHDALADMDLQKKRQRHRRDRLVQCLSAIPKSSRQARLRTLAKDNEARSLLEQAVKSFTDMLCINP